MRRVTVAAIMVVALSAVLVPLAVYAAEPQFHFITENGNIFIISPPDLPRPANIISETAHLAVHNPPAGLFVATAPGGTTHRITPLQSGLNTDGFAGGKVRIILGLDWDGAPDKTFRDQAFGTMSGDPMRHANTMQLAAGWNNTYDLVPLRDDSCFGLGTCANNMLGLTVHSNDGYKVSMGSRERAGLDFGPGTGADHVYYIYRGCSSCNAKVVVGHGDPADDTEALPNDLTITDHYRGWKSTGSCNIIENSQWSGRSARTLSDSYTIPAAAHSTADNHYIDSRYDDLSLLPQSHSTCSGLNATYSADGNDNRKHDMCVTGTGWSSTTVYRYPITTRMETTTTTSNNGTITTTTTTTTSTNSATRTAAGSCTTPATSGVSNGYLVSARCSGGGPPSNPPTGHGPTQIGPVQCGGNPRQCVRIVTTVTVGSPGVTTNAGVWSTCDLTTNTPHLNLDDAMTIRPGLNVYQPGSIPATRNILAIYDDAENGGGGNEYIQVYRSDGPGPNHTGPYDFHLKPNVEGMLYDAHQHYGWVERRTYSSDNLADMGYTQEAALSGVGDGLGPGGAHPYANGQRLCHGNCFMGPEGADHTKPMIREVSAASSHSISPGQSLTYDHRNDRWFTRAGGGDRATATTLYLVVPFAEDVSIGSIMLYDHRFDPTAQLPSLRTNPDDAPYICHLQQSGAITTFASSMDVENGDSLHIPVISGMRYAAFIGNGDCYWYDVAALPSPLSSISSGARHVPLTNGTLLAGDLTARHDGTAHVDVTADLTAVWQSEMHGMTAPGTGGNATWIIPPLQVELTAVARVNSAHGTCGMSGVYCSNPIVLTGTAHQHGAYIHGATFLHGEPYAKAPVPLPTGTAGNGIYGLADGRCYGLANVEAETGGILARSIPQIPVSAGDTIVLSFEAEYVSPEVVGGNVTAAAPASSVCMITESSQSAVLDIITMTATLR